jgi:hypothetical protein
MAKTKPSPDPLAPYDLASFWENPTSYITIATYILPIIAIVFHRNVDEAMQAVAAFAPIAATVAYLIVSLLHRNAVVTAASQLALERLYHENKMDQLWAAGALEHLPASERKLLLLHMFPLER